MRELLLLADCSTVWGPCSNPSVHALPLGQCLRETPRKIWNFAVAQGSIRGPVCGWAGVCPSLCSFFAGGGEDSPWLSILQILVVSCVFLNHVTVSVPEEMFPRSARCR